MTAEERHRYHFAVVHPKLDTLALRICEATSMDDRILADSRYQDLLAFYEEQTRSGHWHPALTESIGDFTASRKPAAALPYYQLALDQARKLDCHSYTILIFMAKALIECGQKEQAEACLRDGRAEALQNGDDEWVREADSVRLEASL